jgi:hypothetical protein
MKNRFHAIASSLGQQDSSEIKRKKHFKNLVKTLRVAKEMNNILMNPHRKKLRPEKTRMAFRGRGVVSFARFYFACL